MKFMHYDNQQALAAIQRDEGPFLSVYLPFGIAAIDDKKKAIVRKNLFTEAQRRVEDLPDADYWSQSLEEMQQDFRPESAILRIGTLPRTIVFIVSPTMTIKTELQGELRAHFTVGTDAQVEPLIYSTWVEEPFYVLKLNPDKPEWLVGEGGNLTAQDFSVPRLLRNSFGESSTDFGQKNVLDVIDRNDDPGADLMKSGQTGISGLSSRQTKHSESNRHYWLGVMSQLLKESVHDQRRKIHLVGDKRTCEEFIEMNHGANLSSDRIVSKTDDDSDNDLMQTIQRTIRSEKLSASGRENEESQIDDQTGSLFSKIERGAYSKIFVQQDDQFVTPADGTGEFEFKNKRVSLLVSALKGHVQIKYTNKKIPNEIGIAGAI